MLSVAKLKALGQIDALSIRRDPTLFLLTIAPVLMALALRLGIPPLTIALQNRFAFDLVPFYPLLVSFVAMTMPGFVGAILAFVLLDQRDDGTLTALQVTPLSLWSYLTYRAAAPMAVSLVMTCVALPITGLMAAGPAALLVYGLVAAPFAPAFALFTACIAANKVQGFAVMKAAGVLSWPAVIAWFLPMPWQLSMGIVPHYWIAKVVWLCEAGQHGWWMFALVAIGFQLALLWQFLRRFEKIMRR